MGGSSAVTSTGLELQLCSVSDFAATPTTPVSASRAVVLSGAAALVGFACAESTGSGSAKFRLRDGSAGAVLRVVTLVADESRGDWFGELPLPVSSGVIYLEIDAGQVEGSLYWV